MSKASLCGALALGWMLASTVHGAPPQNLGSEWLSTPGPIGSIEDVTARIGVEIVGGVAMWATPIPGRVVEHVAGRTPGGDLHVFWWGADGAVNDVNVTAKTGVKIVSAPIAWLETSGEERIAAIDTAGAVRRFTWTPATDWTAETASTRPLGKTYTGNLVRWLTPGSPPVQHIAATATDGEIFVFWRREASGSFPAPFSSVSVTAKTGIRSNGGLAGAWITRSGDVMLEHLAAAGADGKAYDLVWSPVRDWTAFNVPMPVGKVATPDAVGWRSVTGEENVAVRTTDSGLVVATRSGTGGWVAVDVTGFDGEVVSGRPAPYPAPYWSDALAVAGEDGEVLVFWRTPQPVWRVLSLSDLHGLTLAGAPAAMPVEGSPREVVAGVGADRHLRVVRDFTEARNLTERLYAQFETLRAQTGVPRTVTILWNPETNAVNCAAATGPGCPPCNPAEIGTNAKIKFQKAAAVDAMRQVSDYFRENSGGLFAIDNVATLGWYASVKTGAHYWHDHGVGKCMDGWGNGGAGGDVEKWAEAIRLAGADFDFGSFDFNRDGALSRDELTVIVMIPTLAPVEQGFRVGVVAEKGAPLVVRGVRISNLLEVYVRSPEKPGSDFTDAVPNVGLVAHELSHQLLDSADQYWVTRWLSPFPNPTTALGVHSLMDSGGHHDGFNKLKYGWVRPRIVWRPGRYGLRDVETRRSQRVLLNPLRGVGELLLFENRLRGSTFDRGLPADGLAIYHVMQDPAVYRSSRPPFHMSDADWSKVGPGDWGHRALRLIRPVATSGYVSDGGTEEPYDDGLSLWRAEGARTGYDLEPFPASRGRAWLRWADGTNPGVAVRSISRSGPTMAFTLAAVPLTNPTLCAARGKSCGWIDDGFGGKADCGTCTGSDVCGGGGVPNVCGCQPKTCDGRCGSVDLGCGLGHQSCGACDEGYFCNPQRFCQPIPEPCPCGGKPPACLPCLEDPLLPADPPPAGGG